MWRGCDEVEFSDPVIDSTECGGNSLMALGLVD